MTLQNAGASSITVKAEYQLGPDQGTALARDYAVGAGRRLTLCVPDEVGTGKDVSVRLTCPSPFLAERPVYFDYPDGSRLDGRPLRHRGRSPGNALALRGRLHRGGFPHLALPAEPGAQPATVEMGYLTQERGALPARQVMVPPTSRHTLRVNDDAGTGLQLSILLKVTAGEGIVAERPMYFHYQPNDVISLTAVGMSTWTAMPCVPMVTITPGRA